MKPGRLTLAASLIASVRCDAAPSSCGVTATFRLVPTTSVSGRAKRFCTISRASAAVSPPTSVPPTVTPAAISFGTAGLGLGRGLGTGTVGVVSVGGAGAVVPVVVSVAVPLVSVVVPSSAPACGAAASTTALSNPATAQAENAAIFGPLLTRRSV